MECSTCKGMVKTTNFVCVDCSRKLLSQKVGVILKLRTDCEELKHSLKLQQERQLRSAQLRNNSQDEHNLHPSTSNIKQIRRERQKRQQQNRNNDLKEQIKQLENKIMEQKIENNKYHTMLTSRENHYNKAKQAVMKPSATMTGKSIASESALQVTKLKDSIQQKRRTIARTLFSIIPLSTNPEFPTQSNINQQRTPTFLLYAGASEQNQKEYLYINTANTYLPLYDDLWEFAASTSSPTNAEMYSACMSNIAILVSYLAAIVNVALPHPMKYEGNNSVILTLQRPDTQQSGSPSVGVDPQKAAQEAEVFTYPLYYNSSVSKKDFGIALQLLNQDVVHLCTAQGIVVAQKNLNNFRVNLLLLTQYNNIGDVGPFDFYNHKLPTQTATPTIPKVSPEVAVITERVLMSENYYYDKTKKQIETLCCSSSLASSASSIGFMSNTRSSSSSRLNLARAETQYASFNENYL